MFHKSCLFRGICRAPCRILLWRISNANLELAFQISAFSFHLNWKRHFLEDENSKLRFKMISNYASEFFQISLCVLIKSSRQAQFQIRNPLNKHTQIEITPASYSLVSEDGTIAIRRFHSKAIEFSNSFLLCVWFSGMTCPSLLFIFIFLFFG